MKRLVLLIPTLTLALAAPAAAKGPDQATITGPGLDGGKIVFRSGGGDPASGTTFGAFVESIGFFPAMFGQVPDPMLDKRPSGNLGPRYKVVYRVPGPDNDRATIRQDLYPYASLGIVAYMKPGQPFFGGREKTRGGWFVAGQPTTSTLVAAGFPRSAPTGGGGSWFDPVTEPWLLTLVVVLLLGVGAAVVVLLRPRFRPAS
ncbi:MAG TPA: hypothetical protein VGQ84_11090 [Gaiellaceae bacterium]|jgi:hypothetical protein|nr:hypothetical protein [Gaiellaceae bacterium]